MTVASPPTTHPQNAQNEPALAVSAIRPDVLAAGANDLVDMQPCSRLASTEHAACSFPLGTFNLGVGLTGVYFSFDRGHSWIQPTYSGLTAADCSPTVEPCVPHVGQIHTVPNYYENGLRSRSDPGVAFGPAPGPGGFSWANGDRLYFSSLSTNLTDTVMRNTGASQNGFFGVNVSSIDNPTPARIANQANWSRPYFAAPHAAFSSGLDKEQIWADNAESSPFFGNVYVCYADFHSFSGGNAFPLKPMVSTSRDGGVTWKQHQVAPPIFNVQQGYYQGCTVRTDSHGVVYVFLTHLGLTGLAGSHTVIKSLDGGQTWRSPQDVVAITDPCFHTDTVTGRCIIDGIAGARTDLAAMPSVDIANGAPTGADATNEIVNAWVDGRDGPDHEKVFFAYSTNGAASFSTPTPISPAGDISAYAAPAISPDGKRVYVTSQSFTQPFQTTTANPRPEHGVLQTAAIGAGGAPGAWTTEYTGPLGDARGSSQGRILYNEFLGDYVYSIATRDYGAGVWTDVRRTADCPAFDAWRQQSSAAGTVVLPAPWPLGDCPAAFGNNDIFSATTG
ncbi:sialidase family protein [Kribbella sp. NPDC026596]|uniref:sialidase family protein n=1 Tax=Kribbella sp. NPDC026596 TaxID=3155122 RepID=UPI0033CD00A3